MWSVAKTASLLRVSLLLRPCITAPRPQLSMDAAEFHANVNTHASGVFPINRIAFLGLRRLSLDPSWESNILW